MVKFLWDSVVNLSIGLFLILLAPILVIGFLYVGLVNRKPVGTLKDEYYGPQL